MQKLFLLSCLAVVAVTLRGQTVSRMDELTADQKAKVTDLKLTGRLSLTGNSDFRQLRDLCYQLETVDLGSAICTEIPKNAFHSRHRLRRIVFPEMLQTIGTQAFYACNALKAVELPATVERVGEGAFSACSALEELTINGAPNLGDFAFAHAGNLRIVRVNSRIPPQAGIHTFEGINRKKCKLIVPKGAELAYRRARGWKNFFFTEPNTPYEIGRPGECLAPVPEKLQIHTDADPLEVKTLWDITATDGLDNERQKARDLLDSRVGTDFRKNARTLTLRLSIDQSLGNPEGYTLHVGEKGIDIKGGAAAGVFYGLMTLDQLLAGDGTSTCCDALPQLTIADSPRTRMRELMLDPARIFIPFDELKKFVPEMARYKLNALHLHLVDDQAWRIEIKHYPKLTEQAASRTGMDDMQMPISGYYTQAQMRELVRYAAEYHVQVIPEIEMPGHEVAAIHCYPQLTCGAKQVPLRTTCGVSNELLCPGNEFTYEFLGNVFRELADVFPSPYIHLGGDEAGQPPLECWTNCPADQALKGRLGITSTDGSENWRLQEYLFNRVIDTLQTRYGKTPMCWYETDFKRIRKGCITFAWRIGLTQAAIDAAVANGAQLMLCPGEHCYFDYPMATGDMPEVNWGMPVTSLRQTYALDPGWGQGEDFGKNTLMGVAGTLWSECINSPERIYYQAFPRAIALAEAGWSRPANRSWESFVKRLRPRLADMMHRGLTFSMEF